MARALSYAELGRKSGVDCQELFAADAREAHPMHESNKWVGDKVGGQIEVCESSVA